MYPSTGRWARGRSLHFDFQPHVIRPVGEAENLVLSGPHPPGDYDPVWLVRPDHRPPQHSGPAGECLVPGIAQRRRQACRIQGNRMGTPRFDLKNDGIPPADGQSGGRKAILTLASIATQANGMIPGCRGAIKKQAGYE
jgi:hypothetical protein